MSNSSSKYSGITLELVIKVTTLVAGIKALITAIDENATVNIRDANGVIIHQETGVTINTTETLITLSEPVFLMAGQLVYFEFLY